MSGIKKRPQRTTPDDEEQSSVRGRRPIFRKDIEPTNPLPPPDPSVGTHITAGNIDASTITIGDINWNMGQAASSTYALTFQPNGSEPPTLVITQGPEDGTLQEAVAHGSTIARRWRLNEPVVKNVPSSAMFENTWLDKWVRDFDKRALLLPNGTEVKCWIQCDGRISVQVTLLLDFPQDAFILREVQIEYDTPATVEWRDFNAVNSNSITFTAEQTHSVIAPPKSFVVVGEGGSESLNPDYSFAVERVAERLAEQRAEEKRQMLKDIEHKMLSGYISTEQARSIGESVNHAAQTMVENMIPAVEESAKSMGRFGAAMRKALGLEIRDRYASGGIHSSGGSVDHIAGTSAPMFNEPERVSGLTVEQIAAKHMGERRIMRKPVR